LEDPLGLPDYRICVIRAQRERKGPDSRFSMFLLWQDQRGGPDSRSQWCRRKPGAGGQTTKGNRFILFTYSLLDPDSIRSVDLYPDPWELKWPTKIEKKLGNLSYRKCDNHAYKQANLVQKDFWKLYCEHFVTVPESDSMFGAIFPWFGFVSSMEYIVKNVYRYSFPFFSIAGSGWRGAGFGSSFSCRANCHWQALPIPAYRGTSTNANSFWNFFCSLLL
jgi:hypothetical protein